MQVDFNTIFNSAGYLGFIVGSLLYARSKVPNQTITNYKLLTESQEKRIAALEEQKKLDQETQVENIKAIADLQGQLKTYKDLPLKEIAEALGKISNSNELILSTLNKSAVILADEKTAPGKVTTTISTVTK